MDEPTRISAIAAESRAADPFRFGDDGWMDHLRSVQSMVGLGRIGAFEILEEVGRGGQGIVYRARQPHTNRLIALKRLAAGALAGSTARRRFEREVEAVSALNHPNIVTVYGLEIVDDQPLLAMEWIDGAPIHKWAQAGGGSPPTIRERLELFVKVCAAVQHAHQRGVIHRDLKPGNVLVALEASADAESSHHAADADHTGADRPVRASPKILDFGLAKLIDPQRGAAPDVTMSDEFVGTPAFAAPEQVRLDHDAIDARTDVYSLGVILYLILTQQMPYEISRNLATLVDTIQRVEPRRPSLIDRRIDRDLDTIVLKALAKEQTRRYQTVDALAEDLRRYLAGDPILAHPPRATYYLKKMLWRYRLPVAIAGLALAAIVGLAIVAVVSALRATHRLDMLYLDDQALRAQAQVFTRTLADIDRAIADGDRPDVVGALQAARRRVVEGFVGEATALPSIDAGLAHVFARLGQADEAEARYRRALAQLAEQGRADGSESAAYQNALGLLLYERGDWREAERLLREALRIRTALKGRSHRDTAMTMSDLGVVLLGMGRLDEARTLFERALAIVDRLARPYPRDVGVLRLNLGETRLHQGDAAAARGEIDRAIDAFQSLSFHRFDEYAKALFLRGSLDLAVGNLSDARPRFEEAIAVWREAFDDWHPRVAFGLLRLAETAARQGLYEDALQSGRDALAIRQLAYGDDHELTRAARATLERIRSAAQDASQTARPATMPSE